MNSSGVGRRIGASGMSTRTLLVCFLESFRAWRSAEHLPGRGGEGGRGGETCNSSATRGWHPRTHMGPKVDPGACKPRREFDEGRPVSGRYAQRNLGPKATIPAPA